MSKVLVTESHLNSIAEAIRSKNGTSTTYRPGDMAAAIQAIPTGITPTGTLNISENGTYDVTQYASASVNISAETGTMDIFISSFVNEYLTGWYGSRTVRRTLASGPKLVAGIYRYSNGYSSGAFYTLHDYGDLGNVCSADFGVKKTLSSMDFPGYGSLPIYAYGGMNGSGLNGNCVFYKNDIANNIDNVTAAITIASSSGGLNIYNGPTEEADFGTPYNSMSDELKSLFKQALLLTLVQ